MSNDVSKRQGNTLWDIARGEVPEQNPAATGLRVPPPPPLPPPGPLSKWFDRPVVQGLYYNGKTIALDGYQFVGCRFDNCTLMVSSTNFDLINCVIDPVTTIQYGNDPIKIVHLFNSRNDWMFANIPDLAPLKNADGSITINGVPR